MPHLFKANLKWFNPAGPGRSPFSQVLILSCCFSIFLLILRVLVTGKPIFLFLVWNLFLAWVPYALSAWLLPAYPWKRSRFLFFVLFLLWLIFLPNSFYILTDLFHLRMRDESSLWFDLTMIYSFAWNGLLLGMVSLRQMEKMVVGQFNCSPYLFLFPVMWLSALGIYIGRFMRFNSWDLFTNPFDLLANLEWLLIHPVRNFSTWGTIFCFAALMTFMYLSIVRLAGKAGDR